MGNYLTAIVTRPRIKSVFPHHIVEEKGQLNISCCLSMAVFPKQYGRTHNLAKELDEQHLRKTIGCNLGDAIDNAVTDILSSS